MRTTPRYDLLLDVPKTQVDAQRRRLEKEQEQLEKNIASSTRQLSGEKFLGRAPAQVVETMRTKLAEYEAQLARIRALLAE
jgi:valyl-tRNA synthetase